MKIKNITDVTKFFETIEQCKGKIELVTSEGDRINLKSKLCQYIMISKLFSEAKIDEMEIFASEPEDLYKILEYLVRA
ncbi:MAG: polya polymerase [Mahellales bacterium]